MKEQIVKEIADLILEHGEYLPTIALDSEEPEWSTGEVNYFAAFLADYVLKREAIVKDKIYRELLVHAKKHWARYTVEYFTRAIEATKGNQ